MVMLGYSPWSSTYIKRSAALLSTISLQSEVYVLASVFVVLFIFKTA